MKFLFVVLVMLETLFGSIGTIMAMRGEAVIERGGESIAAQTGVEIEQKDTLVTQAGSMVQVMLEDETVVTVGAKSRFSFEEYLFEGQNSKVQMRAHRGFFRTVTGKISKFAPQRFKVKTSSATIGIRGTDFWGEIGADKEVIGCSYGAISVIFEGVINEVDAGEYIQIEAGSIEKGLIQKYESGAQNKASAHKNADVTASQTSEMPTEDLADVTQNANEALEPFGFRLDAQEREQEF